MKLKKRFREINLKQIDFWLLMSVVVLLAMGLIMIFSASAPSSAEAYNGDAYFIFRNQLKNALLGIVAMLIFSFLPYKIWSKLSIPMLLVSFGLLIVVLLPGYSKAANGASRWIDLGFVSFQPSEVAKFSLICFFAASLASHPERLKKFFKGLAPYFLVVGAVIYLLMKEPHMSCSIIVLAVCAAMLLVAGARMIHFILIAIPVGAIGYYCVFYVEKLAYLQARIFTFLDPWQYKSDEGYQIINSLYAVGSGGPFGKGIGKSMQKFLYIPEPHNDFIFAILAEELGFIGVATVLILFLILIWRGLKTAIMTNDRFGSLLAFGITSLIAIQSFLNIAVVTASFPVTGVSLPFFSYGGTSLILFLAEIGVLLNVTRYVHVDTILPANEIQAAQLLRRAQFFNKAKLNGKQAKA